MTMTNVLLMASALGELRSLVLICLPIWMFFGVSALNQNKGKSTLRWTRGNKAHGQLFFKVDERGSPSL